MPDEIDQDAVAISEMLLNRTGIALMNRDFDLLMTAFSLPQTLRTFEGTRVITTIEEMKAVFGNVCDQYERKAVTDLVRFCVAAQHKGADRVEATHVAHLLSGTTRVAEPYPVFSVLERLDGVWKITASDYAVEPNGGFSRALLLAGMPATDAMHDLNRLNPEAPND